MVVTGVLPGEQRITVLATNAYDCTTSGSITVVAPAPAPVVRILSPTPDERADLYLPILFQGEAELPLSIPRPLPTTALAWTLDSTRPAGVGPMVVVTGLAPGPHAVAFSAVGPDGTSVTTSVIFFSDPEAHDACDTVDPQDARPIKILVESPVPCHEQQTVFDGTPILLQASATDASEGVLPDWATSWSSSLQGLIGAGRLIQTTDLVVGDHVLTVSAQNAQGLTAATTIGVCVQPLPGPSVQIQSPLPGGLLPIYPGQPLQLRAAVSTRAEPSPEPNRLTWSIFGTTVATGLQTFAPAPFPGERVLVARYVDSRGRAGEATTNLHVEDPSDFHPRVLRVHRWCRPCSPQATVGADGLPPHRGVLLWPPAAQAGQPPLYASDLGLAWTVAGTAGRPLTARAQLSGPAASVATGLWTSWAAVLDAGDGTVQSESYGLPPLTTTSVELTLPSTVVPITLVLLRDRSVGWQTVTGPSAVQLTLLDEAGSGLGPPLVLPLLPREETRPIVTVTPPGPVFGPVGQTPLVTASAVDNVDGPLPAEEIRWEAREPAGTWLGVQRGTVLTAPLSPGSVEYRISAQNSDETTGTTSVTVVGLGLPGVSAEVEPPTSWLFQGAPARLVARADWGLGEAVPTTYTWHSSIQGALPSTAVLATQVLGLGQHELQVTAAGPAGLSTATTLAIFVAPAPGVSGLSVIDASGMSHALNTGRGGATVIQTGDRALRVALSNPAGLAADFLVRARLPAGCSITVARVFGGEPPQVVLEVAFSEGPDGVFRLPLPAGVAVSAVELVLSWSTGKAASDGAFSIDCGFSGPGGELPEDSGAAFSGIAGGSRPGTPDDDWDDDGIANAADFGLVSNPFDRDTDGDGIADSAEAARGTWPQEADSDMDGWMDGVDPAPTDPAVPGKPTFADRVPGTVLTKAFSPKVWPAIRCTGPDYVEPDGFSHSWHLWLQGFTSARGLVWTNWDPTNVLLPERPASVELPPGYYSQPAYDWSGGPMLSIGLGRCQWDRPNWYHLREASVDWKRRPNGQWAVFFGWYDLPAGGCDFLETPWGQAGLSVKYWPGDCPAPAPTMTLEEAGPWPRPLVDDSAFDCSGAGPVFTIHNSKDERNPVRLRLCSPDRPMGEILAHCTNIVAIPRRFEGTVCEFGDGCRHTVTCALPPGDSKVYMLPAQPGNVHVTLEYCTYNGLWKTAATRRLRCACWEGVANVVRIPASGPEETICNKVQTENGPVSGTLYDADVGFRLEFGAPLPDETPIWIGAAAYEPPAKRGGGKRIGKDGPPVSAHVLGVGQKGASSVTVTDKPESKGIKTLQIGNVLGRTHQVNFEVEPPVPCIRQISRITSDGFELPALNDSGFTFDDQAIRLVLERAVLTDYELLLQAQQGDARILNLPACDPSWNGSSGTYPSIVSVPLSAGTSSVLIPLRGDASEDFRVPMPAQQVFTVLGRSPGASTANSLSGIQPAGENTPNFLWITGGNPQVGKCGDPSSFVPLTVRLVRHVRIPLNTPASWQQLTTNERLAFASTPFAPGTITDLRPVSNFSVRFQPTPNIQFFGRESGQAIDLKVSNPAGGEVAATAVVVETISANDDPNQDSVVQAYVVDPRTNGPLETVIGINERKSASPLPVPPEFGAPIAPPIVTADNQALFPAHKVVFNLVGVPPVLPRPTVYVQVTPAAAARLANCKRILAIEKISGLPHEFSHVLSAAQTDPVLDASQVVQDAEDRVRALLEPSGISVFFPAFSQPPPSTPDTRTVLWVSVVSDTREEDTSDLGGLRDENPGRLDSLLFASPLSLTEGTRPSLGHGLLRTAFEQALPSRWTYQNRWVDAIVPVEAFFPYAAVLQADTFGSVLASTTVHEVGHTIGLVEKRLLGTRGETNDPVPDLLGHRWVRGHTVRRENDPEAVVPVLGQPILAMEADARDLKPDRAGGQSPELWPVKWHSLEKRFLDVLGGVAP
ncbi:MAG: hypothetical protein HY814_09490 [Candidatus Riflebacteria bacterium]|nr:hypothetical protein [Candidatus Riflebacteria bacterium]